MFLSKPMPNIAKLRASDGMATFYRDIRQPSPEQDCSSECFLHVPPPLGGGTSACFECVHFSRDGVLALTSLLLIRNTVVHHITRTPVPYLDFTARLSGRHVEPEFFKI